MIEEKAAKIKSKKNREEMRRASSRINLVLRPLKARGVTKIVCDGKNITTHEGIVVGFRKEGHSSQAQALNKRLVFDIRPRSFQKVQF